MAINKKSDTNKKNDADKKNTLDKNTHAVKKKQVQSERKTEEQTPKRRPGRPRKYEHLTQATPFEKEYTDGKQEKAQNIDVQEKAQSKSVSITTPTPRKAGRPPKNKSEQKSPLITNSSQQNKPQNNTHESNVHENNVHENNVHEEKNTHHNTSPHVSTNKSSRTKLSDKINDTIHDTVNENVHNKASKRVQTKYLKGGKSISLSLDDALQRIAVMQSNLLNIKKRQEKLGAEASKNDSSGDKKSSKKITTIHTPELLTPLASERSTEISEDVSVKVSPEISEDVIDVLNVLDQLSHELVDKLSDSLSSDLPEELQDSLHEAFEQILQGEIEIEEVKKHDSITEEQMYAQIPEALPVLPLRDCVVFNSMVLPLYETREKGILAIEQAFLHSKFIFLSTQKDLSNDAPASDDIYEVGTVALILRMLKMPKGHLKILVQGVTRAKIKRVIQEDPFLEVAVEIIQDEEHIPLSIEEEALVRTAREQSEKILQLRGLPVVDIMSVLMQVSEPGRIADLIASNMRLNIPEAQKLLECQNGIERLALVNEHLVHEIEIANIQTRIQNNAREGMDKAQKAYFLREQMKAIRSELGDSANADEELDNIREAIEKLGLHKEAKKEAIKQCNRLATMGNDSAEANVIRTYLDWIVELPWKKVSRDSLDIKQAKIMLDEDHFGLEKIKDRILEFLSVRKLNPTAKGSILCFVGPPGVGKTSLGASIARVMNRKFHRISLGGMRDEAEIRGHRRTYIGAMPGRIIQALKQAGTRNPVILLDEIDKLGNDFRGDPSSALLEALDPEQNAHFSDHYLNVSFDLSKVLFICTANSLEEIPSALRDRLEVIKLSGYTEFEKIAIAQKYLIKRQVADNGLDKSEKKVKFATSAIKVLIQEYTREAGLRNLEREIGKVCRKMARSVAEGKNISYNINEKLVHSYLGAPRFIEEDRDKELIPGVATGLAWTAAGGDVLYVEVSLMKGKGVLNLTGQLGDVMKESAQAALSYARAHADSLHLDPDFHENYDFHIHVPAGATPKDGPSAGVTLVTALVSALSKKPVKNNLCMTGEISLRGRVMPVGGIKEKILAAVSKGLTDVIIPSQNTKDLEEIPKDLLEQITIHPVSALSEVLELAF